MSINELKFVLNSDLEKPSNERLKYLQNQVQILQKVIGPEQRTDEWHEFRNNLLTASDWGTILGNNRYSKPNDIILKKCGENIPFITNKAIKWGIKYEEVAIQIYELRNKCHVIEFGCLKHPTIDFLGASPDGITKDGVMLEIKCPSSRKITGVPPVYYYDQVQGQLECCELDRCDFLECNLEEYDNSSDYKNDNYNDNYTLNNYGHEKGVLIEYFDLVDTTTKFIYGPIGKTLEEIDEWKKNIIITKIDNNDNYIFSKLCYWKLIRVSCIPIYRDKEWFSNALVKLTDFWNKILYHRKNGIEGLKKIKKIKKYYEPIFIDTSINMFNTDNDECVKEEPVVKNSNKNCLFSDSDDDDECVKEESVVKNSNKNCLFSDSDDDECVKEESVVKNSNKNCLFSDSDDDDYECVKEESVVKNSNKNCLFSDSDDDECVKEESVVKNSNKNCLFSDSDDDE